MIKKVLIIGLVILIVLTGIITSVIYIYNKEEGRFYKCRTNMRIILTAIGKYQQDNQGQSPPDLQQLLTKYINDPSILRCPCDKNKKSSYIYLTGLSSKSSVECIIIFENKLNHKNPQDGLLGHMVGFPDAEAEIFSERNFKSLVKMILDTDDLRNEYSKESIKILENILK